MPIYEYSCKDCNKTIEVLKSVADYDKEDFCPVCNKTIERLISNLRLCTKGCSGASKNYIN